LYFKVLFKLTLMSKQTDHLDTLREIRTLMERSSRFQALSGLAGVAVGIVALAGVAAAYVFMELSLTAAGYQQLAVMADGRLDPAFVRFFLADATIVLLVSLTVGITMAVRKARKQQQPVWDMTAKRLAANLFTPLVAGGIYCLTLLHHGHFGLLAPATLLFYGLALVNASKYTIDDVRYLGLLIVLTGLLAAWWQDYGLLFWGVGFGVLHIIYGLTIYFKYEQ
jgi:hypothetical protein